VALVLISGNDHQNGGHEMNGIPPSETYTCNTCTWGLVRLCYGRAPWFRLVREPLVLGMRAMAWWHGVDHRRGWRGHPDCSGCVRYMKIQLKEKSPTFRLLNALIDPVFNRMRNSIVTRQELDEARSFARAAAMPDGDAP